MCADHFLNWHLKPEGRLCSAAQNSEYEEVKRLVEEGVDVNCFDIDLPLTPLHFAVCREDYQMIVLLLSLGADINAHDPERIGDTPLGYVAHECSLKLAKILLRAGADLSVPGLGQLTVQHHFNLRKDSAGQSIRDYLNSKDFKKRKK